MKVLKYKIATEIYDANSDSTNLFFDQKERYSDDANYEKNLSLAHSEAYNGEVTVEDIPDIETKPTTDDVLNALLGVSE